MERLSPTAPTSPTEQGEAWVNVFKHDEMFSTTKDAADAKEKKHQRMNITASDMPNVFVRPGAIVPMISDLTYDDKSSGKTVTKSATSTKEITEHAKIDLLVNMDVNWEAKGSLLIDDGESQDMLD